jgi:nardilysin
VLVPGFEGTFDGKMIKFRLVNLAKDGEGAMMKYGDESDHAVETGSAFPAILPALPKSRLPKLVCDRPELKLWHLQDRKFRRPIAELRLRLVCSNANQSPLHQACVDLMVNLCADAVTEDSYLASVCDLGSSISNSELGFTVRVHGFDDKLLRLFETIFDVLLSFRGRSEADGLPSNIKAGRFEACCEVLKRRYENEGLKAHKLCSSVRIHCLYPESWSAHAKASTHLPKPHLLYFIL